MFTRASVVFLTIAMAAPARTQPTLQARPSPPPDYVLGVGDQLSIHVVDLEDIPDRPLKIDPNGYIDLPLVGTIQASGKTVEQLRKELTEKLTKYINPAHVSLNLTDDKGHPVSVVGAVNNPGVQQLQGPRRLIEALSVAGGIRTADAGSTVTVTRELRWGKLEGPGAYVDLAQGVSILTLPLSDLLSSRNPALNVLIQPNDIISVPKADIVYVVGNVRRAGGFPLPIKGNISLLQALSLAEGLDQNAAASRARILRPAQNGDGKPKNIEVNISKISKGEAEDVPLYANDVLYIPNSAIKSSAKRATDAILAVTTGIIIYR